jgi:dCMP deaminase
MASDEEILDDHRLSWDQTWLKMAETMARRSRCRGGAGALAVDNRQRVIATGYAGPPAGYELNLTQQTAPTCVAYCARAQLKPENRDLAYLDCPSLHAEINLISFADRTRMEGGVLYVSTVPCLNCAKAVANSGVRRVVWRRTTADAHRDPLGAVTYLERCGVGVTVLA